MIDTFKLFLSAFLGFLSALVVEWIWNSNQRRKEKNELLQDITDELEVNLKSIESIQKDVMYVNPYVTSIWDGAISTGAITSLRGYKYFYTIARTYRLIESANYWEKLRAETYFHYDQSSNLFKTLSNEVFNQREKIKNEIDKLYKCLEDEI